MHTATNSLRGEVMSGIDEELPVHMRTIVRTGVHYLAVVRPNLEEETVWVLRCARRPGPRAKQRTAANHNAPNQPKHIGRALPRGG